jgi:aldehyde dehydrogenase (NAD+)
MSEELFAPFIPIIRSTPSEAVATISSMPHPLALYIFSTDPAEVSQIMDSTASGGVSINDVGVHYAVPGAPFGGVGESGYGSYHGKYGFDAFSHTRPVVGLPNWLDAPYRYGVPDLKLLSNFDYAKASWKKGETLEDQGTSKGWFGWLW